MRLFDDEFFWTKNGEAMTRAALAEMMQPGNQNIGAWKEIVEMGRRGLVPKSD